MNGSVDFPMVHPVRLLVDEFDSPPKSVRSLLHVDDTPQTEVGRQLVCVTDETYVTGLDATVTLMPLVGWDERWEDRVVPLLPPLLYKGL